MQIALTSVEEWQEKSEPQAKKHFAVRSSLLDLRSRGSIHCIVLAASGQVLPMRISIPERALVLLIGPAGSGKSTFARKHFGRSEVLSSDYCRYLVADDENDQAATEDAFEVLRCIASKRLRSGRLTVIDATNVQPEARQPLLELACQFQAEPIAIVFNLPEHLCLERNANRAERVVLPEVIRSQIEDLQRSFPALTSEGFREISILSSPEEVATVVLVKDEFQNRQE